MNLYSNSGQLPIEGVPSNSHLSLPYKCTITIDQTLPTWGFTIEKIIVKGNEYDINIPAIISSASDHFWISDDLYTLFKDIFRDSLEKGTCELGDIGHEIDHKIHHKHYLTCNLSELRNTFSLIVKNSIFFFIRNILF